MAEQKPPQHGQQQQQQQNGFALDVQRSIRMPSWVSFEPEHPLASNSARTHCPGIRISTSVSPTSRNSKPRTPTSSSSPPLKMSSSPLTLHRQETTLSLLCREHKWAEVLHRCQQCPHEAVPIRYHKTANTTTSVADNSPWGNQDCVGDLTLLKRSSWREYSFRSTVMAEPEAIQTATSATTDLYHETALGLACRSNWTGFCQEHILLVIQSLLMACPAQVDCHQLHAGHTPLRDAVRNSSCCRPQVLKLLLTEAHDINTPDGDGYAPLDYLLVGIHSNCNSHALNSFQLFLEVTNSISTYDSWTQLNPHHATQISPLIRLLLQGTSLDHSSAHHSSATMKVDPTPLDTTTLSSSNHGFDLTHRLEQILRATQLLLHFHPKLLYYTSKCTKCTILHIALRNYGNFLPLIQVLLQADTLQLEGDNKCDPTFSSSSWHVPLVLRPNQYGDLPLHVACSVGVPWNVLTMIVQETLHQEDHFRLSSPQQHPFSTSLVWSVNHSGYTPVDLEWVRHIEAGKGLLTARSFYPLEASGIRKHCRKQDDFYRVLLEEGVRQVVQTDEPKGKSQPMDWSGYNNDDVVGTHQHQESDDGQDAVKSTFGLLLHRIILMVQAAFRGTTICTVDDHCLLHAVVALCRPFSQHTHGFALPRPIMELFLWMCPNQVMQQDDLGRVPLHYVVAPVSATLVVQDLPRAATVLNTNYQHQRATRILDDWTFVCQSLIERAPNAAKVADNEGRLPIHLALMAALVTPTFGPTSEHQRARWMIVQDLVDCYPESVELPDPATGLFPFQLAAACAQVPLESVYLLLRRSPNLVVAK